MNPLSDRIVLVAALLAAVTIPLASISAAPVPSISELFTASRTYGAILVSEVWRGTPAAPWPRHPAIAVDANRGGAR